MDMQLQKLDQLALNLEQMQELVENFRRFRPLIEEALSYSRGTHTFDDVVGMVMKREAVVRFYDDRAFMFFMVHEYPQAKHLHIFLAGGDLETLLPQFENTMADARLAGCDMITLNGRRGWERIFRVFGAQPIYTLLALEVPQDERNAETDADAEK